MNPFSLPCIYNLACVYSSLKKHRNAVKWFNLGIKVDSKCDDLYYGSALSSLKLKEYDAALDTVNKRQILNYR